MAETGYIIVVGGASKDEENEITVLMSELQKEHGCGWWHHVHDVWFMADAEGVMDVSEVRDAVMARAGVNAVYVFKFLRGGADWSAYAPDDARDWLSSSF